MVECRYRGKCRIEYDTDFDVCYPCIGDWGETCAEYEPMPDRDALLELADICESAGNMYDTCCSEAGNNVLGDLLREITEFERKTARIIREACGVESEAAERRVEREEK